MYISPKRFVCVLGKPWPEWAAGDVGESKIMINPDHVQFICDWDKGKRSLLVMGRRHGVDAALPIEDVRKLIREASKP